MASCHIPSDRAAKPAKYAVLPRPETSQTRGPLAPCRRSLRTKAASSNAAELQTNVENPWLHYLRLSMESRTLLANSAAIAKKPASFTRMRASIRSVLYLSQLSARNLWPIPPYEGSELKCSRTPDER